MTRLKSLLPEARVSQHRMKATAPLSGVGTLSFLVMLYRAGVHFRTNKGRAEDCEGLPV